MTQPLLQAADLRGAARLTTEAVAGLASLVEAMHARVLSPRGWPRGEADADRTRGITGLVYGTVRGVTRLVGGGADMLLSSLGPLLAEPAPHLAPRPEREAVVAALNGVLGDHLAASDNPLAIPMAMRVGGRALTLERQSLRRRLPGATPRLLLQIHGLCMNDLQWRRADHDHGEALAREAGFTAVHLHYNTGLSISTNGRVLVPLLERLVEAWPVPLERVVLLGHSMGGLVARSALHHAALPQREAPRWPARVTDLVCLGTPHRGAPLEKAGHGVDVLLGAAPYAAPLARLGRLRSAGIQDLRVGRVAGGGPAEETRVLPDPVPLPAHLRCFALAGCLGPGTRSAQARLLGDGLVPVASALGQDRDPARCLAFPPEHQAVIPGTGHLDLLCSAAVHAQLRAWLA